MSVDRLKYLFARWTGRMLSEEEEREFIKLAGSPEHRQLMEELIEEYLQSPKEELTLSDEGTSRMLKAIVETDAILREQSAARSPLSRRLPMRRWMKYAAIMAGAALCAVYLYNLVSDKQQDREQYSSAAADRLPLPDGAILTLADGTTIELDSSGNRRLVASQSGARVLLDNGRLMYDTVTTAHYAQVEYNTLSTSIGRQFKLELPDGTQVWLNAASSVRYPVRFSKNERVVELTGEAYFDVRTITVANKKVPFIVKTSNQSIEVVGTAFNVKAYADDDAEETTLVEGKVNVRLSPSISTAGAQVANALLPGQQAVVKTSNSNADKAVSIRKQVDMEGVLAWKNGFFKFEGASIPAVMKNLQRWYDIKIEYPTGIPTRTYSGEIPRRVPLSQLIEMLRYAEIDVELKDNKLIINK